MRNNSIKGNIVDVFRKEIFAGEITFCKNGIISIVKLDEKFENFILPGFIDAHVHIESSMLTPSRFAEIVVPRGTIGVVSDPHEIANVLGVEGVEYMINDGKKVPLKFFFGAPSCVPATSFESSGAVIDSSAVQSLLRRDDVWFLSEMMNFPGVIYDDVDVHKKLNFAKQYNKPIDGHAPGLTGSNLDKYVSAGISTDHECSTLKEAEEKISKGMMIQIREGSAARNFEALKSLFKNHPDKLMLCTDDSHPDDLISQGHMDRLLRLGLKEGINLFDLLRAVTINPAQHYNLPIGLLRVNDPADFIVVEDLDNFNVVSAYIEGERVYHQNDGITFDVPSADPVNKFRTELVTHKQLEVKLPDEYDSVRVIEVHDGELLTSQYNWKPLNVSGGVLTSDLNQDIIKLVVVNRYKDTPPSVGFVKNLGLKKGAIGSTVAHDSHNIIVAGCDDDSILRAINVLIEGNGGIVTVNGEFFNHLPLPVAGLMSCDSGAEVAEKYKVCNQNAAKMGSSLKSPFMTLSFLSLLVIPSLKLGDKGLFNVADFEFTSLFVSDK
ncbi:adenine deaminase [Alkalitalea saponilacus]|uniref:Adenine deaminase n=1 Tax=Alkalitalea saponilacus TaxID=889453 RepID=A0A1T5EA71_9BACT|nr:adenine deaminase [Alkalitalea saponilacus]ASB49064.1 adenine deaminase [Alkalitalea saponilacus]SKB80756.1 Adenine deaminase [Alkalitalea saponilacus]